MKTIPLNKTCSINTLTYIFILKGIVGIVFLKVSLKKINNYIYKEKVLDKVSPK